MPAPFPDLTDEDFTEMDTSGDGHLDVDETAGAVGAGRITPADG